MPQSSISVRLAGLWSLETLRSHLNELGVQLVLSVDPTLTIYWMGEVPLDDIPAIVRSQTGVLIIRKGHYWMAVDPDGDQVPMPAREGEDHPLKLVSRAEASSQLAYDSYLGSLGNVSVELWVVDASLSASLGKDLDPSLTAEGAAVHFKANTIEGGSVSINDTEERNIRQFSSTGEAAGAAGQPVVFQSSLQKLNAGLDFRAQARNLGGAWQVMGTLEISRFTAELNKTQRKVTINMLVRRGEWAEVAELDRGDVSATISKSWGLSGSVRRLKLFVVLR